MKRVFLVAIVVFGFGPFASAQELALPTSQEEVALRRNILTYPQAELGRLMGGLGSIAPSGTYNLPFPSQIRAEAVHALRRQAAEKLLRYDSDGDGAISQTEARAVLESGFEGRQEELTAFLAAADANGDGALNPTEIEGLKDRFAEHNLAANLRPRRLLRGIDPAVFDLDGDRKVRRDELVRYVDLVIAAGPARIDPPSETGPCTLPPVSTGAVITLVGGQGGGAALADHTVAGPDAETQVVYLDLPEGPRPVYLMLRVNGPTIYQFSGAVDRIEHVVAGHVDGAVGIEGVDASRIRFVPMDLCFGARLETGDSIERLDATAPLSFLLGRQIDRVIVTPFLRVDVVTGAQTNRPDRPTLVTSAGSWRIEHTPVSGRPDPAAIPSPRDRIKAQAVEDFLDHFPLGLKGFVRGAIVSPGRVDAYSTLPGAAGLNAWLASGIAVATGREAEIALVVPVLRWPGGLGQARALTVLLPDGVPMPAGDPGNWIILSADRSRCLAGRCPP